MFKLKTFAIERPLVFSLLVILLGSFLTEIPIQKLLVPYMGAQPAYYLAIILEQGIVGGFIFILLGFFGWLTIAGFAPLEKWRALWLGWPLLVFALINLEPGTVIDTSKPELIALHLLTALSTGWIEEILFRGAVLVALLQKWGRSRKGIYLAVLVSSALFGVTHLLNFIQGRKPLLDTATQITFAIFFGVMFCACFLRNRTIWPVILLHAAVDWAGTLDEIAVGGGLHKVVQPMSANNALISILITLPLFLYGLFILRKVEPDSLGLDSAPAPVSSSSLTPNHSLGRAVK